ncbi:MAG: hypothetical protein C4537_05370 [Acholeplasma sp.]|jgi:hypothetical protein|nr:MAG: hypothetical protein C4537_05370 [Acholeplasma sp.]
MTHQDLFKQSEPWLKYQVAKTFLSLSSEELQDLKHEMLEDPFIQRMLSELSPFHDQPITNHKHPQLPIHKLLFLLDLGLDPTVPPIDNAIKEILSHVDPSGVYQSNLLIPTHFGGTGSNMFCWCLCDAPLLMKALKMTQVDESYLKKGIDYLISLKISDGFPCAASPELRKFRGPGKKDDICPYATLIMLDLLSYLPKEYAPDIIQKSLDKLLTLWQESYTLHPYLFYMGKDFRKLKAPMHWYDLLSVCEVLSKYSFIHQDPRYQEMIQLIKDKRTDQGWIPESVYLSYKMMDFGQKKVASPYLTFLCERILGRNSSF